LHKWTDARSKVLQVELEKSKSYSNLIMLAGYTGFFGLSGASVLLGGLFGRIGGELDFLLYLDGFFK